jgi:hypothetical protein
MYNYIALEVVVNKVVDDRGLLFSKTEPTAYTTLREVTRGSSSIPAGDQVAACNSKERSCMVLMEMTFSCSTNAVENIRVYKSLTEVLGTIGGVKEIIFLVFSYIHLVFTSGIQKKYLVEKVFGIVPETTKYLCCRRKKGQIGKRNSRGSYFVPVEVFEQAYKTVLSCIDICTLSHEMFVLRFISSALLRDYQLNLMPLIALNHFIPKESDKEGDTASDFKERNKESDRIGASTQKEIPAKADSMSGPRKHGPDVQALAQSDGQTLKHLGLIGLMTDRYSSSSKPGSMMTKVDDAWLKLKECLENYNRQDPSYKPSDREGQFPNSTRDSSDFVKQALNKFFSKQCYELLEAASFKPLPETDSLFSKILPFELTPPRALDLDSPREGSRAQAYVEIEEGHITVPPYSPALTQVFKKEPNF